MIFSIYSGFIRTQPHCKSRNICITKQSSGGLYKLMCSLTLVGKKIENVMDSQFTGFFLLWFLWDYVFLVQLFLKRKILKWLFMISWNIMVDIKVRMSINLFTILLKKIFSITIDWQFKDLYVITLNYYELFVCGCECVRWKRKCICVFLSMYLTSAYMRSGECLFFTFWEVFTFWHQHQF